MGDPLAPYVTEKTTPEQYEILEEKHGVNDPIQVQYVTYLRNVITFDWGYSKVINQDVSDALRDKFAATLELSILAFIVAVGTAIPLGIFSSIRQNRWEDHSIRLFALAGSAIPIFWFALFLQYFFAITLNDFMPKLDWPISLRYDPILWEITDPIEIKTNFLLIDAIAAGSWPHFKDALQHMILPATVLAYGSMATIIRLMRGNMLDVLGQDYIRTAKSKGLTENQVTYKHGAPNAMIPTVTLLGMGFAGLINGSVLTETIFTWPGLGAWAITAMRDLDVSAILAYTLFSAFLYIIANLIVDILYAFLDPRVELGGHSSVAEILVVSLSILLLIVTYFSITTAVWFGFIILISLSSLSVFSIAKRLMRNPEDLWIVSLLLGTLFVVWSILSGFFMTIIYVSTFVYILYIGYSWKDVKVGLAPKFDEFKRATYQIKRNPLTILGLFLVLSLLSIALFAPFLAPPSESQRDPMAMEEHFDFNNDHQSPCINWSIDPLDDCDLVGMHSESVAATATITLDSSKLSDGETITLISAKPKSGTKTYTAIVGPSNFSSNQFSIDGNDSAVGSSLKMAIESPSGHDERIIIFHDGAGVLLLIINDSGDTGKEGNTIEDYPERSRIIENSSGVISTNFTGGENKKFILGSTDRGYDIYYGIVWGSRTSLDVAVKVVITGTFIAAVIGAISGYYGGRVDDIVMRITDVFIAIPGLVLALAIIAVTGDNSIEMLMYSLIIVWWPGFTRVIRAEALRIRKLPYIEAAKAAGASDFRIIFKHVLPNCITSIIVIATMDMGGIVLSLAGLGFLGFGGGADLAEWGKLVSFGQDDILKGEWWGFFFPGLAIALWALGFYLLGDGVRDILDPKQRN